LQKILDDPFGIIMNHFNATKMYELPDEIAKRSDWMLKAHVDALKYNSRTVRLDDLKKCGNQVMLTYSNVTYWDLLMTNRAMDYEWEDGRKTRDVYEPGPYISPLASSKMANHIGFNGFIDFKGHGILFTQRSGHLSVGKRTLGTNVSAKLEPSFDYKKKEFLTTDKLYQAVADAINKELKYLRINNEKMTISKTDVEGCIFAFYRDLVEGGKPQFLFYYRLEFEDIDNLDIQFEPSGQKKQIRKDKKDAKIDGSQYIFLTIEQLKNAKLEPHGITLSESGEYYKMTPSAVASVVMLLAGMGKEI
jgi:hypothetical protein